MRIIDGYWVIARDAEYEFGLAPGSLAERGFETGRDIGGELLIAARHVLELRREGFEALIRARRAREVADGLGQNWAREEIDQYVSRGVMPTRTTSLSSPMRGPQTMPSGAVTRMPTFVDPDAEG
jgi:hypothetical protein